MVEACDRGHVSVCVGGGQFSSGVSMNRLFVDTGSPNLASSVIQLICRSLRLLCLYLQTWMRNKGMYLPSPPPSQQQNIQTVLKSERGGSDLIKVGRGGS